MDDTSKNIEEYIPNQKQKILILFDDMIADMLIVTDSNWIIYQRKKTISLLFIIQSYFAAPNNIILTSTKLD